MAATPGLLYRGNPFNATANVTNNGIYTVPADGPTLVKTITMCNPTGGTITASVSVAAPGTTGVTTTPIATTQLYAAGTLTAATTVTVTLSPNVYLNSGETLCITPSATGAIFHVSGVEHTGNAPATQTVTY